MPCGADERLAPDDDLPKHGSHEALSKVVVFAWYTPPSIPVSAIFFRKVRTSCLVLWKRVRTEPL